MSAILLSMHPLDAVRAEMDLVNRATNRLGVPSRNKLTELDGRAFHVRDCKGGLKTLGQGKTSLCPVSTSGAQLLDGVLAKSSEESRSILITVMSPNSCFGRCKRLRIRNVHDDRLGNHDIASRIPTGKYTFHERLSQPRNRCPFSVMRNLLENRRNAQSPTVRHAFEIRAGFNLNSRGDRPRRINKIKAVPAVLVVKASDGEYYLPIQCGKLALVIAIHGTSNTQNDRGPAIDSKYQIALREHPKYHRSGAYLGICREDNEEEGANGRADGRSKFHLDLIPSEGVGIWATDRLGNVTGTLYGQQIAVSFDGIRWYSPID